VLHIETIDKTYKKPYFEYVSDPFLRWYFPEEIVFKTKDNFKIKDSSSYLFMIDSLPAKAKFIKSNINGEFYLRVKHSKKENVTYQMTLYPNVVQFYDSIKIDTFSIFQQSLNKEKYSSVSINFEFSDSITNHVVEILNNNTVIFKQNTNRTNLLIENESIPPGEYEIRIFKDKNNNNFYDESDLFQNILPEERYFHIEKLILRENWDISNYTIKY